MRLGHISKCFGAESRISAACPKDSGGSKPKNQRLRASHNIAIAGCALTGFRCRKLCFAAVRKFGKTVRVALQCKTMPTCLRLELLGASGRISFSHMYPPGLVFCGNPRRGSDSSWAQTSYGLAVAVRAGHCYMGTSGRTPLAPWYRAWVDYQSGVVFCDLDAYGSKPENHRYVLFCLGASGRDPPG